MSTAKIRKNIHGKKVNLKTGNEIHLKNNFYLEIFKYDFLNFTEKLIINYTIIHEHRALYGVNI